MADVRHISFVPVTADHYALLSGWLNAPHMREWWGDPAEELGYIREMVDGRDTTRPYLFAIDGKLVGYIQYWFIGHHQNEEWIADHPWLAELPKDAIGVDLSIGEEGYLSSGIGSEALTLFVKRLRADGHNTIIIDPDPNNGRAVRAYAKAGFRPIPHLQGRTGDVLIMQHETNTNGLS